MDRHSTDVVDRHSIDIPNDADAPAAPEFLQRSSSQRVEDVLALIMDRHTDRAADGRLVVDRHSTGVVDRHSIDIPNDADVPAAPEFLQRSSSQRVEDVLALQAEEHYVRIYSKDGTELVHCRFGEAAEEMPAELGLQVHRAWWVAESAVRSARRGSRRWQLDLVTDVAVPVSDSYVAAVREREWLKRKART